MPYYKIESTSGEIRTHQEINTSQKIQSALRTFSKLPLQRIFTRFNKLRFLPSQSIFPDALRDPNINIIFPYFVPITAEIALPYQSARHSFSDSFTVSPLYVKNSHVYPLASIPSNFHLRTKQYVPLETLSSEVSFTQSRFVVC